MAVYQMLKTRIGIKQFLLQSQNGSEEHISAFEYADGKIEVHLVKRECAPLYLDEFSSLTFLNSDNTGVTLVVVTPTFRNGIGWCAVFRCWDAASTLGFTPKEILVQDPERNILSEGKFRAILPINDCAENPHTIPCDNVHVYFAMLCGRSTVVVWRVNKLDSGIIQFDYFAAVSSFAKNQIINFSLMTLNDGIKILLYDTGGLSLCKLEADDLTPRQKLVSVPNSAKFAACSISAIQRVHPSICILTSVDGGMYLFNATYVTILDVRLPSSGGDTRIFTVLPVKDKFNGILVVCNDGYTINQYSLSSLLNDIAKGKSLLQRPLRTIFSKVLINSLVFVGSDILVGASSSNRTLSFWGGIKADS